jgi:hypothetical protein
VVVFGATVAVMVDVPVPLVWLNVTHGCALEAVHAVQPVPLLAVSTIGKLSPMSGDACDSGATVYVQAGGVTVPQANPSKAEDVCGLAQIGTPQNVSFRAAQACALVSPATGEPTRLHDVPGVQPAGACCGRMAEAAAPGGNHWKLELVPL